MKPTNAYRPMSRRHIAPVPAPDYDKALEGDRARLIEALREESTDFARDLLRELEGER